MKDGNPERHKQYTGVTNDKILKNLFLIDNNPTKILLRCLLVRGVNNDDENYNYIASVFNQLKHCIGVELLPYHAYGGTKNKQLGFYDNGKVDWIPSSEDINYAKAKLQSLGVVVI